MRANRKRKAEADFEDDNSDFDDVEMKGPDNDDNSMDDTETADEARIRLARQHLARLQQAGAVASDDEDDDDDDEDSDGGDVIARKLAKEIRKQKPDYQRQVAKSVRFCASCTFVRLIVTCSLFETQFQSRTLLESAVAINCQ